MYAQGWGGLERSDRTVIMGGKGMSALEVVAVVRKGLSDRLNSCRGSERDSGAWQRVQVCEAAPQHRPMAATYTHVQPCALKAGVR